MEERKFRWERWKFLITVCGGFVVFGVGLWQFATTARNEHMKPLLEKQIDLCLEITEIAAELAQVPGNKDNIRKFYSYYFGKLGVVEDKCLYDKMRQFNTYGIGDRSGCDVGGRTCITPGRAALEIAFACRRMISNNWSRGPLRLANALDDAASRFNELEDYQDVVKSCK